MALSIRRSRLAPLLAFALLLACGGDDSAGARRSAGACDQRSTLATCVEHGVGVDVDYSRGYCEAQGGTWTPLP